MSEIWTPSSQGEFDTSNVFELAKFLQGDLESFTDYDEHDKYEKYALGEMRRRIEADKKDGMEYRVDAAVAILEDYDDGPTVSIEHVRLFGVVAAAGMAYTNEYSYGISLKLDAISFARLDSPDEISSLFQLVRMPAVAVVDTEQLHVS